MGSGNGLVLTVHYSVENFDTVIESIIHDDVITWKHFLCCWPFMRGIHRSPVNFPHKDQWRGALMFFYLRPNKWLSKQWRRLWFETPSGSLWRHCNVMESWTNKLQTILSIRRLHTKSIAYIPISMYSHHLIVVVTTVAFSPNKAKSISNSKWS